MSTRPFMQLYVSDFVGDTLHLSAEQVGAYMLLLMAMWNAGGRLPDDEVKLSRIVRMTVKRWRTVAPDIMGFFTRSEGAVTHRRLSDEIEKSDRKSELRATAGSKGGEAKSRKDKEARLANATPMPCHSPEPDRREEDSSLRSLSAAQAPSTETSEPVREPVEQGTALKRTPTRSPAAPANRGTRLTGDWRPDATMVAYAESLGFTPAEIQIETEKIRDWSVNSPNGAKKDWPAAWRNWLKSALERKMQHAGRGRIQAEPAPFSSNPRLASAARNLWERGREADPFTPAFDRDAGEAPRRDFRDRDLSVFDVVRGNH